MPEQGSIVCPDCGAAYQSTPEQSGKLLHCKCGRYLVAGGNNHKSAPSTAPAKADVPARREIPTPKAEPSIGVKGAPAPTPKTVKAEVPTPVAKVQNPDEAEAGESKNYLSVAVAIVAILMVGAGFFLLRPASTVKANRPQTVGPTAPVSQAAAPCASAPNRLANGTSIAHSQLGNGMGKLDIENAMPSDVVVRMTGSANLTVLWVYVQQGQKVSIDNVPLGAHRVLISLGSDWDSQNLNFKCNDAYAELEKPLEYTDRREDDRTTYSAYRLVLGKQRTEMITKDDFFMGYIGGAK